jgi:hypothetical protein
VSLEREVQEDLNDRKAPDCPSFQALESVNKSRKWAKIFLGR